MRRPFRHLAALLDAKYGALEAGLDLEYFHASEDRQAVRDQVLDCLVPHLGDLAAYSIVIEKTELAAEMRRGERGGPPPAHVIVVTDILPVRREREAVEKALNLQVVDYISWAPWPLVTGVGPLNSVPGAGILAS